MAKYNQLTKELILQLQEAAPGHILTGDDINEDYSHDEMPIYGKKAPQVVLVAHST
jgi:glycolate oxidase